MGGVILFNLRERILVSDRVLILALAMLAAGLFVEALLPIVLSTCGAYAIFACARLGGKTVLGKVNDEVDISYGLYLYAWPVEQLLIQRFPAMPLFGLAYATWVIAAAFGLASWMLIERPVMAAAKRRADPTGFTRRKRRVMRPRKEVAAS